MELEEAFVQSADGTQIQYFRYGSGEPVILLHGLQRSADIWFDLLADLPEGRSYIMPNLRGRGRSDAPSDLSAYHLERFVDDLEAVVHEVTQAFVLLGWSMGASVAWAFSHREASRKVSKWVFVSGTPDPVNTRALFTNGSCEEVMAQAEARVKSRSVGESCSPRVAVAAWMGFRDFDFINDPPKLNAPSLVIHGDRDMDCPVSAATRLSQIISSDLVVFEGAQHNPMRADRQRFVSVLSAFLAKPG